LVAVEATHSANGQRGEHTVLEHAAKAVADVLGQVLEQHP
jgi:hypothetical protein